MAFVCISGWDYLIPKRNLLLRALWNTTYVYREEGKDDMLCGIWNWEGTTKLRGDEIILKSYIYQEKNIQLVRPSPGHTVINWQYTKDDHDCDITTGCSALDITSFVMILLVRGEVTFCKNVTFTITCNFRFWQFAQFTKQYRILEKACFHVAVHRSNDISSEIKIDLLWLNFYFLSSFRFPKCRL